MKLGRNLAADEAAQADFNECVATIEQLIFYRWYANASVAARLRYWNDRATVKTRPASGKEPT